MPFTLRPVHEQAKGLIRTSTFSNTNNNLTNLNGTMLLAKLNSQHIGIFVSGKMIVDYPMIAGRSPHAETNLMQAMKDTWVGLPWGPQNVLSIKLSKSPCKDCTDKLIDFVKSAAARAKDLKIRVKIMALYQGTDEENTMHSNILNIGRLGKEGIVCTPWALEDAFELQMDDDRYRSRKATAKSGRTHELRDQTLTPYEHELMGTRTAALKKKTAVSERGRYKVVKVALTETQKTELAGALATQLTEVSRQIVGVGVMRESLRKRIKKTEREIARMEPRGRRITAGSWAEGRIKRLKMRVYRMKTERHSELMQTLGGLSQKKELLAQEIRALGA